MSIELRNLTKRYGDRTVVDDVSATVVAGSITGFLGPNGAGKSTTMRMIVGLDRPTAGSALINGQAYTSLPAPIGEVGVLLDAKAIDKGRSARNHLRAIGATVGIGRQRVNDVLDIVGLSDAGDRPTASFSLGMSQRLGIAAALLADPGILILDEPVNGLDVDGIQWLRRLLAGLAEEGRTVLLSSHLMSELEMVADRLLIIGNGQLLADTSMVDFVSTAAEETVTVTTPAPDTLIEALDSVVGATVIDRHATTFTVCGVTASAVGDLAAERGIALHALTPVVPSLEAAYLKLTEPVAQYVGAGTIDTEAA